MAYRPLRHAPRLAPLITAVGMSFIVQNIALAVYGVNYRTVPNFIPRTNAIHIGDIVYSWSKASRADHRRFRSCRALLVRPLDEAGKGDARRRPGHRGLGDDGHRRQPDDLGHVPARRRRSPARPASSTCCSSTCATTPGFELGLIAFTAAVLGGIGNLTGAVLGALLIGFIQAFNEGLAWSRPGATGRARWCSGS